MSQPYSETYRLACEMIEAAAVEKLGRALTSEERRGIWDAGSLMMLEVVERDVEAATTAIAVSEALVEGAVTFKERRRQALAIGMQQLSTALGRPFTAKEGDRYQEVATLYEAMYIVERVLAVQPRQRWPLLQALLFSDGTSASANESF